MKIYTIVILIFIIVTMFKSSRANIEDIEIKDVSYEIEYVKDEDACIGYYDNRLVFHYY